jgi:hypothetical protein
MVALAQMAIATDGSLYTLQGIATGAVTSADVVAMAGTVDGVGGQKGASGSAPVAQVDGNGDLQGYATSMSHQNEDQAGDSLKWNDAVVDSSLEGSGNSVSAPQSSGRDYYDVDAVDAIPRSQVQ